MPEQSNHVAVIGLGAMGLPMAANLATVFSVTGFARLRPGGTWPPNATCGCN
jgi:hypothetical protein